MRMNDSEGYLCKYPEGEKKQDMQNSLIQTL